MHNISLSIYMYISLSIYIYIYIYTYKRHPLRRRETACEQQTSMMGQTSTRTSHE